MILIRIISARSPFFFNSIHFGKLLKYKNKKFFLKSININNEGNSIKYYPN